MPSSESLSSSSSAAPGLPRTVRRVTVTRGEWKRTRGAQQKGSPSVCTGELVPDVSRELARLDPLPAAEEERRLQPLPSETQPSSRSSLSKPDGRAEGGSTTRTCLA